MKWSARAELLGEEVPVLSINVAYALDTLPTASLVLAVGREPTSNEEAKAVEAFLDARPYSSVKIYIKGETEMDSPRDDPGFPFDEEVMIFDGYLEGVAYETRRTPAGGSVSLVAHCVGWLAALGGSVSSVQTNTVKGPGGFDEIANFGPEAGVLDVTTTYGVAVEGVVTNMWTDFVKPLFREIAGDDNVWGESSNQSALAALDRMDNSSGVSQDADTSLIFPLGQIDVPTEFVQQYLLETLARTIYNQWRDKDMWSVMVLLADQFRFAIVPIIDSAYCAAVFPTLGGEIYTLIELDEYHHIQYRADAQANVTRLAVVDAYGATSNPRDPEVKISGVVGLYQIEDVLETGDETVGLTREIGAPGWLLPLTTVGKLTRISIGGDALGIPDAVNPGAFVEEPDEQYNEIYSNYITSELGDNYARLLLENLFFRRRAGTLTGRFRLDIAPGSTIAIQVINDKFSDEGATPREIVAMVTRVTLKMDAGSYSGTGSADTTLELSHIRSQDEHDDDRLVSVEHPIFETRFVGTKLWFD
ncbi:MAG TPA: hypothetical protein VLT59_04320 [Steroidobacteraceae bacterium]|nr:hypothetical protein [Steroidobacteraceae bacterium]